MEEKAKLRNQLFEMYFEEKDGIATSDLIGELSFITDTWKQLHILLEENVEYFDASFGSVEMIKKLYHNGTLYLVIKIDMWNYVVIDLEARKVLSINDVKSDFKEEFFIDNFSESKIDFGNYIDIYIFSDYEGNKDELIDFYTRNEKILSCSKEIFYKLEIGEARTYFIIDLASGNSQLRFETPDQFLYDTLHLESDLTPFGLQSAQSQIGIEKMKEMFARIPDIKIPKTIIPTDICQILSDDSYKLQNNDVPKQKKK